jgi:YD repeat-containing protein
MIAPANENLSLAYNVSLTNGATKWTLTFNTGEKRTFEITNPPLPMTWILTSITDRNGNTTQLTWNGSSLVTVTDPASRHLYFSYANNLVVGVSSDAGISLSYAYDAFGRLTTVTKPDLTTVSFQYDSNSMISAVVDTNGKVMEAHTYDGELRGVTSSRAGGVDAVTVTYPFFILGAQ